MAGGIIDLRNFPLGSLTRVEKLQLVRQGAGANLVIVKVRYFFGDHLGFGYQLIANFTFTLWDL